ncbi:type IV secretion protein Rhs [Chryseobacterium sp. L7]|uniref:Type IV secretion protein Rhs n=1 Tax=Chryseobacterium endalhagicum TaxID=2797638 RepID=A0ABS1QHI1_9FLAO|nr:RHS repeat-associated core domain-containing protein [Chryseobacterium endalhagicum]MBL1222031.1 type IV secretion protein Rhs [Chryseobacterium endalhagicum]
MKIILSFLLSLCSVIGFSQTILYQTESTSRTVQDPQTVVLAPGFKASSGTTNPFVAKIGPGTENPGGGPTDSNAGANNPSGTTAPQDKKFHDTKGNIEVTQSGQLQYTLDVDLPPGVKNMIPNISLVYVSGAGNGLVGYGWNISGLTAISRVGKNLEKDGITKGVQLDYSDYYSFNGQRLILKSGEYGKDGAEYQTEKYSNIKIKSVGAVNGQTWQGPEYWEVTSPDGSQVWYGATATGSSTARTPIDYNIVKSRDINGNYITYSYTVDGNVSVISSIEWGGNETKNTPHFNKIDFIFVARPMPETAYIKGNLFSQSKLLESIVVSTDSKQYKKYKITYKKDLQETAYRYLEKIIVLNNKNEEANPASFTYEKSMDIPNPNIRTWTSTGSIKTNDQQDIMGDFDGDGKLDLIRYHSATSSKVPQIGVYLYKDFYTLNYFESFINPIYLGNSVGLDEIKNAVPTNFKKNNVIYNRQGFASYKKVLNPATSKNDLEVSLYIVSTDNILTLDLRKIIPNADYDNSSGTTQNGTRTTIVGLKNVDFNGDGLSELILQLNDRECQVINPLDPGTGKLPSECESYIRYYAVNPDEPLQSNSWYYPIELYGNSDEDIFLKYRGGDFNGDGAFDFLKIDSAGKPLLITFQKNTQGQYESSISAFNSTDNETIKGSWDDGLVGDYNGDGLSDLMMPTAATSAIWYIYTSKGKGFVEDTKVFERHRRTRTVNTSSGNINILSPTTFVAYDINNDGKTELILLESGREYYKEFIQDSNLGVKYTRRKDHWVKILAPFGGGQNPTSSNSQPYPGNITMYLNENNINAELAVNENDLIGLPVDQWTGAMLGKRFMLISATSISGDNPGGPNMRQIVASHPYYDISMEGRIKTISQAGITTEIVYKELDKNKNPGLYDSTKTENYPYIEINQSTRMYVVSGITKTVAPNKILKQDFRYRGLTSNILGRGMICFRKTARSSWYTDGFENTKVWTGVENDPLNDAITVKKWSIRTNDDTKIFPADVSENNTQLLSFESTIHQIDKILNGQVIASVPDAEKDKVVTAIVPKISKEKDFITGTIAESTVTYGEYYLPAESISKINSSYAVTTSTYTYNNNASGTGTNYYIGRPKSKTEVVQAYGDTKSGKEEYTYESNRIKTIKKWNRDNTGFLLETYGYDDFGNITEKMVSNSTDAQTQTIKSEYEAKGRFIAHTTDHLGLVTTFIYNDFGQILTQTDPLQNTITNTYDEWGKLLTSKSNLEGMTTYQYIRDSNANITTIQYDPDGNVSKKYINKLGQVYKSSTKAFGQDKYVSKEIQYDILGRKIQESEPYFEGQSANLWNIIKYDDTVFPAIVTSTSFNGKKVKTSVSGLTTTEEEENGNQRITSKTTDALENLVSSTDKGGTIEFSYNATGEQIQAKYGENTVTTKFDVWGRKSEYNDPSNGIYKYEYDGFGQPKKIISPKGTKEYTYNNLGQLISQKELSTVDGGQTTDKIISFIYDNKGRITSKSGTSKGKSYSSNLVYDPRGRLISSSESSNGKYFIQKGITYDDRGRVINYEKQLYSSGILSKVILENVYNTWNGELHQIKDKNSGKVLWELKDTNARGQVLKAKLGASDITNLYNDATGFLKEIEHISPVQGILNIQYTFDAIKNELNLRKTLGGFNIIESFNYDTNNRLTSWTNPKTGQNSQNIYDIKGRITENDQVGTMKYENPAKIYQPTGMTLNATGTQNYNNDLVQTIIFNENNDPVFIDGEKGDVAFQYGLTNMRQKVTYGGNFSTDGEGKFNKFYSEDGSFEVVKDNVTGKEKHTLYIGATSYESNIIYFKNYDETSGSYKFLHKDYIGSILAISDEVGNKLEQRHFDAWGNFTHLQIASGATITDKNIIDNTVLLLERGYTSHEHFTEISIIHMNGRLYDPLLRRFLNADENIQDPTNTQNYNKYGYVMNNPLMYSDPDGEFWLFLAGTLVGGYLNGVQANGSWNPGKWNWEKTWSSVLGGAIGGAAVSGALGNIANNAGAIKSFLPGIVSGGLNSAFKGSNFLGGMIGGISYKTNIFDNKVTSTRMVDAGYRYIISPEDIYSDDQEGDGPGGRIVKIRGRRYYADRSNLPAEVGNIINSFFGGDSDFWVEHQPYNPTEERIMTTYVNTAAGYLAGGVVAKVAGRGIGALSRGTTPQVVMKSADFGRIIGWGESQSAKAVEQTINVTKNLTRSQVKSWAKQGLTKHWVQDQLSKYSNALIKGGDKLKNTQLMHRKELMEKILHLWK